MAKPDPDGQPPPDEPGGKTSPDEPWYTAMASVIVAGLGLLVLFGVVAFAVVALPEGSTKSQNVIALSSSAFGVIGTIVGAYFGVRAANRAVDKMGKKI